MGLWISSLDAFGTTVPNPSIRYTITNHTNQKILKLIQVEFRQQALFAD